MNTKKNKINILECTLRDGSYAIDYQFSAKDTAKIAKALEEAGFKYIEIGHGVGLGASGPKYGQAAETDESYLKTAAQTLTKAKFGMFFIPGIAEKKHLDLGKFYNMGFIRIGTNVTEVKQAKEFVFYAQKLGFEISLNFMKTYALSLKKFIQTALMVDRWGVDTLCIVDSAGCMLPLDVKACVEGLKEKAKARIGFHGHNNLQLAIINSLTAIKSGATIIDTSLRGMGRSAGNAQTEIMLVLLKKLGYKLNIDLYKTMDTAEKTLVPLMKRPHGMSDIEVISGLASFHSSFMPLFTKAATQYQIDIRKLIVNVSKINVVNPDINLITQEAKKLKSQKR